MGLDINIVKERIKGLRLRTYASISILESGLCLEGIGKREEKGKSMYFLGKSVRKETITVTQGNFYKVFITHFIVCRKIT